MTETTTTYKRDIISNPCNYCLHSDICKAKGNLEAIRGAVMATQVNDVQIRDMEGFRLILRCEHYYPKYKRYSESKAESEQEESSNE